MSTVPQRLEADLLKYPGMQADETVVWRTWAALHQTEYDRFDHNVRLGTGTDPGPAYIAQVRRAMILNTQLRIDAVGWQGIDNTELPTSVESPQQIYNVFPSASPEIFEVKRRATASSIGEILSYFHAWDEAFPNNPAPQLRIVCAGYSSTIVPVARANDITLDVVAVNFSILSQAHGT